MVVAVCNGKGGAGKTTVAVLLVLALRRHGKTVEFVDRDPQATGTRWMEMLEEPVSDSGTAPAQFRILDTPPHLVSPLLLQSIQEADMALLVSSSSPADLWTSQDTAQVVRSQLRPGKPVRLLFNQVQRHTLLGRDLGHLSERIGVDALSSHLSRRQPYQHAALLGWAALDRTARQEMLALADEISTFASAQP